MRYRKFTCPDGSELPSVSVIIPAFNEGPMVERSIRSAARSDYPTDKLEIIMVDDGSRDDTFFRMRHLRREFPSQVSLVKFRGNRGKRAALFEGFKAARGDIVVTIDSDSEVEVNTVREMVAPFLADAQISAVAGRVAVLNRDSFISRMLEVQYAPTSSSERGSTRSYQSTAVVNTLAPTRYRQLSRMFVRWDRSYIVEGFSFATFMLTRYRTRNRVLPVVLIWRSECCISTKTRLTTLELGL